MSYDRRNGTDVLVFLLLWAFLSFLAVHPATTGDSTASLMAGLLVTVAVIAVLVVRPTGNLLCRMSCTIRGPTVDEQRLRGAFRRQSQPDTPGRPRPRAPGPVAGAAPLPSA